MASSRYVERCLDVTIDVYGFDLGQGLPAPVDYRDTPNLFLAGAYAMDDEAALRKRLRRARLIIGPVDETVPEFVRTGPAPVAFISFDLDFYSSTVPALNVLKAEHTMLLPRVHCYFDEVVGYTYSAYNGERLAIAEFNASGESRKITPIYGLRYFVPLSDFFRKWPDCIYLAHIFDHPLYDRFDGLNIER